MALGPIGLFNGPSPRMQIASYQSLECCYPFAVGSYVSTPSFSTDAWQCTRARRPSNRLVFCVGLAVKPSSLAANHRDSLAIALANL